jgi:hypothetical protein
MAVESFRNKWLVTGLFLLLAGCQKSDTKILIGATTIPSQGAPPIAGSVIVISGKTIKAVGLQKDVPIPQDSERTDLSGKWVIPPVGGRIAPGEAATFDVLDHAPPAAPGRQMIDGQWQAAH